MGWRGGWGASDGIGLSGRGGVEYSFGSRLEGQVMRQILTWLNSSPLRRQFDLFFFLLLFFLLLLFLLQFKNVQMSLFQGLMERSISVGSPVTGTLHDKD